MLRKQEIRNTFHLLTMTHCIADTCAKFVHPFTCLIAGPTGCGKTMFVCSLLKHGKSLILPPSEKILWCYGIYQPFCKELAESGIEFQEGYPNSAWLDQAGKKLLIIDDQMYESASDQRLTRLFTQGSHHKDLSIICIVQNIFFKGLRTISLNTHYMVLFKNPRDRQQIAALGRQIYPENPKCLQQAYFDATERPYGYLILNLRPDTPERCRMLTSIFGNHPVIIYEPRRL